MGGKSSKMPQQISVENSMQPSSYHDILTAEDYKKINSITQQEQTDSNAKHQQAERYVGQTSVFTSVDNKFQFVVAQKIKSDGSFESVESFEFDPRVEPGAKVLATQFNFYFVRHAKSCANEEESNLDKVDLDDPFISNDGIWGTIAITDEYDKFFQNINVDHYFCSVAIRTWCTAGILFRKNMSDFQIAPHLRESGYGYTNQPYPYATNVNRFGFFKQYVDVLTKGYLKIKGEPGYGLMNKALSNYGSDFITDNGLAQFMQWYIKNENALGRNNTSVRNVVVVCHSDLLMNFCQDHLKRPGELESRGMHGGEKGFFKKVNNYCIQIQVFMPERNTHRMSHDQPLFEKSDEVKTLLSEYRNPHVQPKAVQNADVQPQPVQNADVRPQAVQNGVQPGVAGGNKHKKTRKQSTKLNKHQFKKTRGRKLRGGSLGRFLYKSFKSQNKYSDAIMVNLPFPITIKTVIKGTKSKFGGLERNPVFKSRDCICFPDAYKEYEKTFNCALNNGINDFKDFLKKHEKHVQEERRTAWLRKLT